MTPLEPPTPTSSEPPSTPRNSVGTEHEMESDDRDNDSVFVDNTNDIWEVRNLSRHARKLEGGRNSRTSSLLNGQQTDRKCARHVSNPEIAESKKPTRVTAFRSPIQSDV